MRIAIGQIHTQQVNENPPLFEATSSEWDSNNYCGVSYSERTAIATLLRQIAEDLEATQVKMDVANQTHRDDEAVRQQADNFRNNLGGS